jgi:2-polyprenyl-6-methoxyphenol hydroxylase-like FAD-dependent oxidoreductase
MAGMLTARVLSDHFDQVTIIERDRLPNEPASRPGVPQARHLHALLPRGCRILEEFFPGFDQEMLAAGALEKDVADDIAWMTPQGWGVNFKSGLRFFTFTRDLLDYVVRRQVKSLARVRFVEECEVTGLLTGADGRAVNGVAIRHRPSAGERAGAEEELSAELVVDASGRASKMPSWLQAIGYDAPAETVINAHLGYASRIYELPADLHAKQKAIFVQSAPPTHTRAGIMFPVEGNRWLATLGGGDRDYPPTDEAGFLEFARSLRSPLFYEAIRNARALTPISGYRFTENRRRHYERLKRWPENLLVTGDGACAFNPVYGQGMTTAALGAQLLDRLLREQKRRRADGDLTGLARNFQKRLARVNATPWTLATGEDYRYRGTEGGLPSPMDRFMHRYINHVFQLTTRNIPVRRRFLEVQGMLKLPTVLFHPAVALRVLGNALRNLFGDAKPQARTKAEATTSRNLSRRTTPGFE